METHLNWKKGTFSSVYEIFSGQSRMGELNEHAWNFSAVGVLNKQKYEFKTTGFFRQETLITDIENRIPIGNITYNTWRSKAKINISGKNYNWSYDSFWNSKWSISDSQEILIGYQGSSSKGSIQAITNDTLLLLSGLYISNYYWQFATLAIIILTAIIIT